MGGSAHVVVQRAHGSISAFAATRLGTMGQILQRMMDALYTKKLEVVLVGLENS